MNDEKSIPMPGDYEGYYVVVDGPDDIHPLTTEIEALRLANSINVAYIALCLKHGADNTPMCVATVLHKSEIDGELPHQQKRGDHV